MKKFLSLFGVFGVTGVAFADEVAAPAHNPWNTVIMITVGLALFWLLILRPERKRRKAAQEQRNTMKKGDQVTAMGILGTIAEIRENTVILKLVGDSKMEILKAAISEVKAAESAVEAGEKRVELA